ncbi:hypothetical protein TNCV_1595381 [Trichonephila clavipes]|nr:hypothetical protein TNCV_1595381 [Trichonephila clavipes]
MVPRKTPFSANSFIGFSHLSPHLLRDTFSHRDSLTGCLGTVSSGGDGDVVKIMTRINGGWTMAFPGIFGLEFVIEVREVSVFSYLK